MFAGSRLLLPIYIICVTLVPKPGRKEGHAVREPSLLSGIAVLRRSGSRKWRRPPVAARSGGAGAKEEQVGLETGEWRRCRSLSFTPPASLRSHGSRPRPTRHNIYIYRLCYYSLQGSQNFEIPVSPTGRFGSPKMYLTSPN